MLRRAAAALSLPLSAAGAADLHGCWREQQGRFVKCSWCDSNSNAACNYNGAAQTHEWKGYPQECPSCPVWDDSLGGPRDEHPSFADLKKPPAFPIWPCNVNPGCKVCHANGCDQCRDGYFKMDYSYPCLPCSEIRGCKANSCQDKQGCGQCDSGQRTQCEFQGVQIWVCVRAGKTCADELEEWGVQPTAPPTASPTSAAPSKSPTASPSTSLPSGSPVTSPPTASPTPRPSCEIVGNKLKCDWCDSESHEACKCTSKKCPPAAEQDGVQECPSCPVWEEEDGPMEPPHLCDLAEPCKDGAPCPATPEGTSRHAAPLGQQEQRPWPCDNNPGCKVCHANGCDQCKAGHFKMGHQAPCLECGLLGWKCLVCQSYRGCAQCRQGYRNLKCDNGVWVCGGEGKSKEEVCGETFGGCADGRVWKMSGHAAGGTAAARDATEGVGGGKLAVALSAAVVALATAGVAARSLLRRRAAADSAETAETDSSPTSPMLEQPASPQSPKFEVNV